MLERVLDQARFAYARIAHQRHHPPTAVECACCHIGQQHHFGFAPNQRRAAQARPGHIHVPVISNNTQLLEDERNGGNNAEYYKLTTAVASSGADMAVAWSPGTRTKRESGSSAASSSASERSS